MARPRSTCARNISRTISRIPPPNRQSPSKWVSSLANRLAACPKGARPHVKSTLKRSLQSLAILLLALIAVNNLATGLPFRYAARYGSLYRHFINPAYLVTNQVFSFSLGMLMLLLVWRLWRRVRMAWLIEVVSLATTLLVHILRKQPLSIHFAVIEAFVLIVLLLSHRDFCRRADRLTFWRAFGLVAVSIALVLLNASVGLFLMRRQIHGIHDLYDALWNSVQLLVFMDRNVLTIVGRAGTIYADSLIATNWMCILASAFLLLKPLVISPLVQRQDQERVRQLVNRYGRNPVAYLAVEEDKKWFFGSRTEGVVAYRVVGKVMVVCGDMICAPENAAGFLEELLAFCRQNDWNLLFLTIADHSLDLLRESGFGVAKYGEDAMFRLSELSLAGGRVAKVRAAINHANRKGIEVREYKPLEMRDPALERQISEISRQWLADKGGDELVFMLGSVGLAHPMDRRYFYSIDPEGVVQAFVVFLPYEAGRSYMAEVTRRRRGAPQGVMEKIIWQAFMQMLEEGAEWGTMGLSPLYNVAGGERAGVVGRVFAYVYENLNRVYDFKTLHHSKEKFAPTDWIPRYIAWFPQPFSLAFGYALLKAQMSGGMARMLLKTVSGRKDGESSGEPAGEPSAQPPAKPTPDPSNEEPGLR